MAKQETPKLIRETVNEARTTITDKDGKALPVPIGTDPHLEKQEKKPAKKKAADK